MPTTEFYNHDPQRIQHQVEKDVKILAYLAASQKRSVMVSAVADVTVTPQMRLQLSGTGTDADTLYDISIITFIFDQPEGATEGDEGGAIMQIQAKVNVDGDSSGGGGLLDDNSEPATNAPSELGNMGSTDLPSGFG